jgi:hypothetical protein
MENQDSPQKKPLPQEKQTVPGEITIGTWFLMGGVALFFDTTGALINLIPVAGQILEEGNDLFADATFWLWFTIKGSKYSKKTMFGTFILKFVPFLNMLPEYTLMIIMMYIQSKGKKVTAKIPGGKKTVSALEHGAEMARENQERIKKELGQSSSKTHQPLQNISNTQNNPNKQVLQKMSGPSQIIEMERQNRPVLKKQENNQPTALEEQILKQNELKEKTGMAARERLEKFKRERNERFEKNSKEIRETQVWNLEQQQKNTIDKFGGQETRTVE